MFDAKAYFQVNMLSYTIVVIICIFLIGKSDAQCTFLSSGGSNTGTCPILTNTDLNAYGTVSKLGQSSDCCNFCSQTPGCMAFAWNNYNGGTCYLKNGAGPIYNHSGVISGSLYSCLSNSSCASNQYCTSAGTCCNITSSTTNSTTSPTTNPTTNSSCSDNNTSCATWGTNGFCSATFYTTTTKCQYCPATCSSLCNCSLSTCSDSNSNCATWGANGFCTSTAYTTSTKCQYCSATCGSLCGCSSSVNSTTCTNSNSNCATWVSNGFCSSSLYSVAQKCQYCASSCNLCSTCASTSNSSLAGSSPIVACTDSSTPCSNWNSNGFCNSAFYSVSNKCSYCKNTCKLCGIC